MAIKSNFIILAGVVSILTFSSCHKNHENKCLSYTRAQVTKVGGPNVAPVNQEADLTVNYYLTNGCGRFERLESSSNGNTTIISVIAKYEGCICTANLLFGQTIYKFKASQTGIYYLKFLQPDKTYLTDTITVN